MPNIQTHTFPNGFRVIYEQPPYPTEITYINAFCRVGSIFEPENLRGVSHFIEHMCFKGTRKLANAREIFEVYDNIGAYFNAYTEKQFTCYVSTFDNAYTDKCITTISDMMLMSTFNQKEYTKEINVVIEENVRNSVNYENISEDLTSSMLYKGSVYAYPVDSLKYHKLVEKWDYANVLAFYHQYYVPENMMLSIVSSVPFHTILRIVKSSFFGKDVPRPHSTREPILNIQPKMMLHPQTKMRIQLFHVPNIQTAYISIGFRTCSLYSEDKPILELLQILMGGKYTAMISMLLREKHGLTYRSVVTTHFYEHSGDIVAFAITDSEKIMHAYKDSRNKTAVVRRRPTGGKTRRQRRDLRGVLPVIVDMLNKIIHNGVDAKDLENAKMYMRGKFNMNLAKGVEPVEYNGTEWFLRNTERFTTYSELYNTVYAPITRKDLHAVIRRYFTPTNLCVAIVGGNLPEESRIKRCCEGIFR